MRIAFKVKDRGQYFNVTPNFNHFYGSTCHVHHIHHFSSVVGSFFAPNRERERERHADATKNKKVSYRRQKVRI